VHPIQFGTKTFVKKDPQLPALRSLSIDKAGELATRWRARSVCSERKGRGL
jgi:hypothetical protein